MSKKRFNALDAFIIAFVAACIITAVFKISGSGVFSQKETLDAYEIRFTVADISANSQKYFIRGDTASLTGGTALGTVERVDTAKPTGVYVKNSKGETAILPYPENTRINLSGTILSYGKDNGNGYLLGGLRHIAPGDRLAISTEHIDVSVTVTEIVKK